MNKNIFTKIFAYCGINYLRKIKLIRKDFSDMIKEPMYIHYLSHIEKNLLLLNSVIHNINYFVENLIIYPNLEYYVAFNYTIENNNIIAFKLLLNNIDPTVNKSCFLVTSVKYNRTKMFKTLMEYENIDPNTFQHYCIRHASFNGNRKIVEALLRDKRLNINNYMIEICIEHAISNKNFLLVGILERFKKKN